MGCGEGKGGGLFIQGEDEVRCERERERGRNGGYGRLPLFSLPLFLRKAAERGTELCGGEGPPRRIPSPPHPHPAVAAPRFGRAPLRPRAASVANRCGRALQHLRPAAAAPSSISAPLRPRPTTPGTGYRVPLACLWSLVSSGRVPTETWRVSVGKPFLLRILPLIWPESQ